MDTDVFTVDHVVMDFEGETKADVLNKVAELGFERGIADSKEQILEGLLERESLLPTGVGKKVVIPHCKSVNIKQPSVFVMRLKHEVDWESADEDQAKLVLGILVPDSSSNLHLKILSKLAKNLLKDDFISHLQSATSEEEMFTIVHQVLVSE